jgi:molybdate transport system substrate-binding protein
MRASFKAVGAILAVVALLAQAHFVEAEAAEIKALCAVGMQDVMTDLGPMFERATGHKLTLTFATGGATVQRARDGEAADVIVAPASGVDGLVKDGKVAAINVAAIARTGISVAVRKGAAKPDISSPNALKRALLAAKSITYLNPADGGASGIHFAKVLDRLGIAAEMKPKTVFAPKASALGGMVANGEAEIGVLQFQLLFSVAGIDVVGPLPADLQSTTVFSAAILPASTDATTAQTLITFLRSPEAATVIKAKGMEAG